MIRRAYHAAWLWLAEFTRAYRAAIGSGDPVALSEAVLRHPTARRSVPGLPCDGEPLTEAETEAYAALMFAAATPTGVEPDYQQRRNP